MALSLTDTKRRDKILRRDEHRCRVCRTALPYVLRVHHVKPVEFGGPDEDENLVSLCANCHTLVHFYGHAIAIDRLGAELAPVLDAPGLEAINKFCHAVTDAKAKAGQTDRSRRARRRLSEAACRVCGNSNPVVLNRHHVTPREHGGPDLDSNLATVCANCHVLAHRFGTRQRFERLDQRLDGLMSKPQRNQLRKLAQAVLDAKAATRSRGGRAIRWTLNEAIARCAQKNKMSAIKAAAFERAVWLGLSHIPESVRPEVSIRLTHGDKAISVNHCNHLVFRCPGRKDAGKTESFDGAFLIVSTDVVAALPEAYRAFESFKRFSAGMMNATFTELLGFDEATWQLFEHGCRLAAEAPGSRTWPNNVEVDWCELERLVGNRLPLYAPWIRSEEADVAPELRAFQRCLPPTDPDTGLDLDVECSCAAYPAPSCADCGGSGRRPTESGQSLLTHAGEFLNLMLRHQCVYCPACGGADKEGDEDCEHCAAHGLLENEVGEILRGNFTAMSALVALGVSQEGDDAAWVGQEEDCPHCGGTGGEPEGVGDVCPHCLGVGAFATTAGRELCRSSQALEFVLRHSVRICPGCGGGPSSSDVVCPQCAGKASVLTDVGRSIRLIRPFLESLVQTCTETSAGHDA